MDFIDKRQALPPGAMVPTAAGPNIGPTPREETNAVLRPDAEQLMQNAPAGRCLRPGCSGTLGVRRGQIKTLAAGGVLQLENSERCRRQSFVCCQRCGTVVPVSHPLQQKLDSDWRDRERLDQLERERAEKARQAAAAAPAAKAAATNPVLALPDLAEALAHEQTRLRADHEALGRRVAELERRLAATEHPF
jgi:hypothetical protein